MKINLSIKGVPEHLAAQLRARAESNHRSLQGELMAIIEQAAADSTSTSRSPAAVERGTAIVRRGDKTVAQIAEQMRRLHPRPLHGLPRSVDIIRELRDGS